jgi:hypothetical protein
VTDGTITSVPVPTGGGAGGTTTCVSNGSFADPSGDGFIGITAPAESDLLAATVSKTATDAVFTWTARDLTASSGEAQAFEFDFTLGGNAYDVEAQRGVDGTLGGELVDSTAGVYKRPANITVTFDDATGVVTAKLPLVSFTALTGKAFAGALSSITVYSDVDAGPGNLGTFDFFVPLDDIDATGCSTTV